VRDNLFLPLEDKNGASVIGCLNIQTRKWNILDFSSRLPIDIITGFNQGNIIVRIEEEDLNIYHFYKISFG
jgi:hypothetical protein